MRLVAGVALCAAGVLGGIDLREVRWFRDVFLMTAGTENSCIRQLGSDGGRVCGMFCERTVTGLAIYASVFASLLHLEDIGVTFLAGLVSGKARFTCGDLFQCIASVVSILSEALWYEISAKDYENENPHSEYGCESDEVTSILEVWHNPSVEAPR